MFLKEIFVLIPKRKKKEHKTGIIKIILFILFLGFVEGDKDAYCGDSESPALNWQVFIILLGSK